jgi:hypothetical protein
MIYSLPNGKVIEMSIEQFLRMTDDDLQYFIARNAGDEYADPFTDSVLADLSDDELDTRFNRLAQSSIDDSDEVDEDITPDLTQISDAVKFCDEDFLDTDNADIY